MSVAAKYLNRELLAVFTVTLLMLLLVAVGGRFIGYLQDAALGKYTGATVMTIIGLRMPEFVQLVAPFAAYVAIVLTLGRFYADQEMVVLQGAGVSTAKLLGWVSLCLSLVVVMVAVLAWVLTPLSQRVLAEYLAEQRAQSEFEAVNPGTFHTYDRGKRVTYSRAMSDDRTVLYDVFLSQRLEEGRSVNVWAEQGTQEIDPQDGFHYLVLSNGKRYESGPDGVDMRTMEFAELRQRLEAVERGNDSLDVEALPMGDLGDDPKARAEWHWRVALPVFAVIGGLMAVGVSRVRPRQGRFAKIVPGALLMLVYYLLLLLAQNAIAERELSPSLGLWPVHAVFAAVGVYLLRQLARPVGAR